jgi:hypothetical protein
MFLCGVNEGIFPPKEVQNCGNNAEIGYGSRGKIPSVRGGNTS